MEHSTSWSTSSNVNGGESDPGGNGGICGLPRQARDSEPERTRNLELGTTWSLPDDKLLLTAAAFQVTKDDVMENVGDDYETLGTRLSNFANAGVFAQVRSRVPSLPALSVGAVVTYRSAMFTGQPDSAAGFDATSGQYTYEVPGYTTLDLFAHDEITERIGLRLNVGNVTDEDYYLAGYRSGSFVYIGDARNAKLALTYSF